MANSDGASIVIYFLPKSKTSSFVDLEKVDVLERQTR